MSEKISNLHTRLRDALDLRNKRAVDLVNDLNIPKSAVSQYLSGKSQKMDSSRLYDVCRYLNVSEPWLLGYDVPMNAQSDATGASVQLSDSKRELLEFVQAVPDEKAALILQAMKLILEASE